MALRSLLTRAGAGYLLAGVFLIVSISLFFSGRGTNQKRPEADLTAAVAPAESTGVVRFTSSVNLAKRMGADPASPPLFRAGVTQAIDRNIEFNVTRAGKYRLVMQMTDTPFVIEKQAVGEYLEVVKKGETVGQTFTIGSDVPQLSGVQVKLEARSIVNGQPADTAPDAPLTATLYSDSHDKLAEYVLPVEQAGLNDSWRWASFPFGIDLSRGASRKLYVEFSSPSTVNGWALSRVSNGFGDSADHYSKGELLINGKPPANGPAADLTFAVLTRSSENKQPRLLVDETELTFSPLTGEPEWFASEPIDLSESVHLLIVKSSNPHLSFFRFIFVPEVEGEKNFKNQLETEAKTVTDQSTDSALTTPLPPPSPS